LPLTPIIDVCLDVPDALRRRLNEDLLVIEQGSIPIDFH